MSPKRSKTAQRLDAIVSHPKTISDVMIAIDRLRYRLERIEETSTTIQVKTQARYASIALSHARTILGLSDHELVFNQPNER
jgi:prephenate dehydratase